MLYKAKTKDGTWVSGFLVGIFKDAERETIDSFSINEGFEGVDAVKVDEGTICEYICKDLNGKDSFVGDIIELKQDGKWVNCLLFKENNGMFSIYPNYSEGSLWRLSINDGVGNFRVIGNKHDNKDKVEWLKMKDLWFKRRIENK